VIYILLIDFNMFNFKVYFYCVPGMTRIQLEINQPQVFTAKCSEPQAVDSDVMGEGSGVAILLSVRTET
jgi:hypothetical protein